MENIQEHIQELFKSRMFFEKEVLLVSNDHDRAEIIHILAIALVRDTLKEHLNFMHLHVLSDFTLKPVINLLFKEIASEWIDYAMDELSLSREVALEELRLEKRVQFIKSLAADYYKHFKHYIFTEIADTFIELLALNTDLVDHSIFINKVINSNFIHNRSILNINSCDQLCKAADTAKILQNEKRTYLEVKVSEIKEGILNEKLSMTKREDLNIVLPSYEQKLQEVQDLKLDYFDDTLQRVKRAMINSLKKQDD